MKRAAFSLACLLAPSGCGGAPTPEELAFAAAAQRSLGERVYREQCFSCHDVEGGIGVRLSPRVLLSYWTPRALFDYTKLAMPYEQPGSLSDEEYWAAIAYLQSDRGLGFADVPLTAASAETPWSTATPETPSASDSSPGEP